MWWGLVKVLTTETVELPMKRRDMVATRAGSRRGDWLQAIGVEMLDRGERAYLGGGEQ